MLKAKGISLAAASAPTHFIEETATAVLVRQVLGAIAEFEKTTLVAKLAARGSGSASRPARKLRDARATPSCARMSSSWRRRWPAKSPRAGS
jgi:hypothetical protein